MQRPIINVGLPLDSNPVIPLSSRQIAARGPSPPRKAPSVGANRAKKARTAWRTRQLKQKRKRAGSEAERAVLDAIIAEHLHDYGIPEVSALIWETAPTTLQDNEAGIARAKENDHDPLSGSLANNKAKKKTNKTSNSNNDNKKKNKTANKNSNINGDDEDDDDKNNNDDGGGDNNNNKKKRRRNNDSHNDAANDRKVGKQWSASDSDNDEYGHDDRDKDDDGANESNDAGDQYDNIDDITDERNVDSEFLSAQQKRQGQVRVNASNGKAEMIDRVREAVRTIIASPRTIDNSPGPGSMSRFRAGSHAQVFDRETGVVMLQMPMRSTSSSITKTTAAITNNLTKFFAKGANNTNGNNNDSNGSAFQTARSESTALPAVTRGKPTLDTRDSFVECEYWVDKSALTPPTLEWHRKTLTVELTAKAKKNARGHTDALVLFGETDTHMRVPTPWGMTHFGVPADDMRSDGAPMRSESSFEGALRPHQIPWFERIMKQLEPGSPMSCGIAKIPCGGGKTVLAAAVACALARRTLITVDQTNFVSKTFRTLRALMPGARIGVIRENRFEVDGYDVSIATIQTLLRRGYTSAELGSFGLWIHDETHGIAAPWYSRLARIVPARARIGLSATPVRHDRPSEVLRWLMGPIIIDIEREPLLPGEGEAVMLTYRDGDEEDLCEPKVLPSGHTKPPNPSGKSVMVNRLAGDRKRTIAAAKRIVETLLDPKPLKTARRHAIVLSERLDQLADAERMTISIATRALAKSTASALGFNHSDIADAEERAKHLMNDALNRFGLRRIEVSGAVEKAVDEARLRKEDVKKARARLTRALAAVNKNSQKGYNASNGDGTNSSVNNNSIDTQNGTIIDDGDGNNDDDDGSNNNANDNNEFDICGGNDGVNNTSTKNVDDNAPVYAANEKSKKENEKKKNKKKKNEPTISRDSVSIAIIDDAVSGRLESASDGVETGVAALDAVNERVLDLERQLTAIDEEQRQFERRSDVAARSFAQNAGTKRKREKKNVQHARSSKVIDSNSHSNGKASKTSTKDSSNNNNENKKAKRASGANKRRRGTTNTSGIDVKSVDNDNDDDDLGRDANGGADGDDGDGNDATTVRFGVWEEPHPLYPGITRILFRDPRDPESTWNAPARVLLKIGRFVGGQNAAEQLEAEHCHAIFASIGIANKNLDIPHLDTVFFLTPCAQLEQPVGRTFREYLFKNTILICYLCDMFSLFKPIAFNASNYLREQGFAIRWAEAYPDSPKAVLHKPRQRSQLHAAFANAASATAAENNGVDSLGDGDAQSDSNMYFNDDDNNNNSKNRKNIKNNSDARDHVRARATTTTTTTASTASAFARLAKNLPAKTQPRNVKTPPIQSNATTHQMTSHQSRLPTKVNGGSVSSSAASLLGFK